MLTKLIVATIVFCETAEVHRGITALLVTLELILSLFLIPIIMLAACIRAMFIK